MKLKNDITKKYLAKLHLIKINVNYAIDIAFEHDFKDIFPNEFIDDTKYNINHNLNDLEDEIFELDNIINEMLSTKDHHKEICLNENKDTILSYIEGEFKYYNTFKRELTKYLKDQRFYFKGK